MPIDSKQFEQWKDLAKNATAGPWRAQGNFGGAATLCKENGALLMAGEGLLEPQDAAFVAAARSAVPALIREVEQLRAVADRAEEEHSQRRDVRREDHSVCDVCWALTDWKRDDAPGTRAQQL